MTSFCDELRRAQAIAARTRRIANMESDESLRCIWGTEKTLRSMKILMGMIGLVYILQFSMYIIHGGSIFSHTMGNAFFLPCVCVVGVVVASMTHIGQCNWKLVTGVLFHCLCSAATSAYVFMFFYAVFENIRDAKRDDFINTVSTIIWGMLCLIYIAISFIFLSFTYYSLHDLFSKYFLAQSEESFGPERPDNGGRILIQELQFVRSSCSAGSGYHYQQV